ncbi:hypothetical protein BS17DRAFT_183851 [Gyrodon lividus]|nr:hypothetical protein BS17DRAFT_183851 [Gyrodon lividus]
MGTMWNDMPPWVGANTSSGPTPNIPPPSGATMLSSTQAPCTIPMSTPHYSTHGVRHSLGIGMFPIQELCTMCGVNTMPPRPIKSVHRPCIPRQWPKCNLPIHPQPWASTSILNTLYKFNPPWPKSPQTPLISCSRFWLYILDGSCLFSESRTTWAKSSLDLRMIGST